MSLEINKEVLPESIHSAGLGGGLESLMLHKIFENTVLATQQIVIRSLLHYFAILQHSYSVRILNGRKPMRYRQHRPSLHHPF